jgi:transposase
MNGLFPKTEWRSSLGTTRTSNRFSRHGKQDHPLFANRRANRLKVLVHDGIGVWLAARRLNQGRFVWSSDAAPTVQVTRAQFDALVLGLAWQRIGDAGVISLL